MSQGSFLGLVFVAAAATGLASAEEPKSKAAPAPHWDYGAEHGPAGWSKLDPAWAACSTGTSQSPIDIPSKAALTPADQVAKVGSTTVTVGHGAHVAEVLNNGHTIQVNYAGADTLVVGGTSYSLVQYHFHGPSEHTVDGKSFPMEMHLVHQSAEGKLAVVGVLIGEGMANAAFDPVWSKLPKNEGEDRALGALTVDVDQLLPKQRDAYVYDGSLTSPPCSEGVKWLVMRAPIQLSSAQVKAFTDVVHGNNRPTQPLNGRKVTTAALTYE